MKTIKIILNSEKSIKEAEKKKAKLEDKGYKFIAQDVGFITATLFYENEKEKKMGKIKDSIHSAFENYNKRKDLFELVRSIANIADYSVHSQTHAKILHEAIAEEEELFKKEHRI